MQFARSPKLSQGSTAVHTFCMQYISVKLLALLQPFLAFTFVSIHAHGAKFFNATSPYPRLERCRTAGYQLTIEISADNAIA